MMLTNSTCAWAIKKVKVTVVVEVEVVVVVVVVVVTREKRDYQPHGITKISGS